MSDFEEEFDKLDQKLTEALKGHPEALELWEELRAAARREFPSRCSWRIDSNVSNEPTVQNYPQDFHQSVDWAIQRRSQSLAAEEIVRRRKRDGAESHEGLTFVDIMLEERDNNTPEYQRRKLLTNAARQLAGVPALA